MKGLENLFKTGFKNVKEKNLDVLRKYEFAVLENFVNSRTAKRFGIKSYLSLINLLKREPEFFEFNEEKKNKVLEHYEFKFDLGDFASKNGFDARFLFIEGNEKELEAFKNIGRDGAVKLLEHFKGYSLRRIFAFSQELFNKKDITLNDIIKETEYQIKKLEYTRQEDLWLYKSFNNLSKTSRDFLLGIDLKELRKYAKKYKKENGYAEEEQFGLKYFVLWLREKQVGITEFDVFLKEIFGDDFVLMGVNQRIKLENWGKEEVNRIISDIKNSVETLEFKLIDLFGEVTVMYDTSKEVDIEFIKYEVNKRHFIGLFGFKSYSRIFQELKDFLNLEFGYTKFKKFIEDNEFFNFFIKEFLSKGENKVYTLNKLITFLKENDLRDVEENFKFIRALGDRFFSKEFSRIRTTLVSIGFDEVDKIIKLNKCSSYQEITSFVSSSTFEITKSRRALRASVDKEVLARFNFASGKRAVVSKQVLEKLATFSEAEIMIFLKQYFELGKKASVSLAIALTDYTDECGNIDKTLLEKDFYEKEERKKFYEDKEFKTYFRLLNPEDEFKKFLLKTGYEETRKRLKKLVGKEQNLLYGKLHILKLSEFDGLEVNNGKFICECCSKRVSIKELTRKTVGGQHICYSCKNGGNKNTSVFEFEVYSFISKTFNKLFIERNKRILKLGDGGGNKEIDILIREINFGVETNGFYSHVKGEKSTEDKIKKAKEIGIDLHVVRFDDWRDNNEEEKKKLTEEIEKRIKKYLRKEKS